MAIYISQNAANNIPQSSYLQVNNFNSSNFSSLLLQQSDVLVSILQNPFSVSPLAREDVRFEAVGRLQSALNIVSEIPDNDFTLSQRLKIDNDFGIKTEEAVKQFQVLFEQDVNGYVDGLFLMQLDRLLVGYYDMKEGKYIGKKTGNFLLNENTNSNGEYEYTLSFLDKNQVQQTVTFQTHKLIPMESISSDFNGKHVVAVEEKDFSEIPGVIDMLPTDNKIYNNLFFSVEEFENYAEKYVPPQRIPDARLYTVQPGDTMTSILTQFYYNG